MRPPFRARAGREPRRDRDPGLPCAARARLRVGRRLLRGRPRRAARAPRRRRAPDRARRARPRATSRSSASSRRRVASGAEAIHPGYGFLAENAAFARACDEAGIVWIGPPAAAIEAMGVEDRVAPAHGGRRRAGRAGHDRAGHDRGARRRARRRARLADRDQGVGGRRRPRAAASCAGPTRPSARSPRPSARARRSSPTARSTSSATSTTRGTSRSRCSPTRHGDVIHLGERDCTLQRRHQKVVEEAPSPAVDAALRARMGAMAVAAAAAVSLRRRRHGRVPARPRRRRSSSSR